MPKKRKKATTKKQQSRRNIKHLGTTSDTLTSRAGLVPFANFLDSCQASTKISLELSDMRKSQKGIKLDDAFFQLLMFFADGTGQSLATFDKLRKDPSWKAITGAVKPLGTAQLKRLLDNVAPSHIEKIRPLIRQSAISALKAKSPERVILFLDSSVYDNDGAKCRGGVEYTYKKKEGYHPINLIWQGMYMDTVFQKGSCSTNHDGVAIEMIKEITPLIREALGEDIPIIVRMDSGYFDQKIFSACDYLKINFVCAGKRYKDHQVFERKHIDDFDGTFQNKGCTWKYCEFKERRSTWPTDMDYRALFLRAIEENGEALLGLDSRIILTNLSEEEASNDEIIKYDHSRGADELTHRVAKEFRSERMPCLDYTHNNFLYTMSILALNLFQIFKRDIAGFSWDSYPLTLRRKLFDVAGKIVDTSRELTLKVTEWTMKELSFEEIWRKSKEFRPIFSL